MKIVTEGGLRAAGQGDATALPEEPEDESSYLSPEVRVRFRSPFVSFVRIEFRPLLPPPSAASELGPTDTTAPDLRQIDPATISALSAHLRHHFTALRRRANKNQVR